MQDVQPSICAFLHHPGEFARRSGLYPLVEAIHATPVFYKESWRDLQKRSWTAGQWLRKVGNWYYGSEWNSLIPLVDENKLSRALPARVDVAHFLWGEFGSPVHPRWFRRRANAIVGTFHASAQRLPRVLRGYRGLPSFDHITLMSKSQMPFFIDQGFPEERMHVFLHGVDTSYFCPAPVTKETGSGPLRGLLVGSTERDHAFMADVLRKLPAGVIDMTILTAYDQRILNYENVPHARFPKHLSDTELLDAYRQADLLVMPMIDCTANNGILESMACGTPVLTNRIGGIPEYVTGESNYLMDRKNVDEWVDLLKHLAANRDELTVRRPNVRAWAERYDWSIKAADYISLYRQCLAERRAS